MCIHDSFKTFQGFCLKFKKFRVYGLISISLMISIYIDPVTQSWIITSITKVLSRTADCTKYIQNIDSSFLSNDAQQRYGEMKSVLHDCVEIDAILPYDASCEDIEIDSSLSFLDEFVNKSLRGGADPYSRENKRTFHVDVEGKRFSMVIHLYVCSPENFIVSRCSYMLV